MQETPQQYVKRMVAHTEGKEPLDLQQAAPGKLAALLQGKDKESLMRRPAPDKWSVAEILAHMADAEVAISWRLRQMLSRNAVPVQAFDQDQWAKTFNYAHRDPGESLESFRVLRAGNIALLKSVPRNLWNNYGVHEERGNESVDHLVRVIAGHDLNHLQQIETIVKG
jgi:hypothetical protein